MFSLATWESAEVCVFSSILLSQTSKFIVVFVQMPGNTTTDVEDVKETKGNSEVKATETETPRNSAE